MNALRLESPATAMAARAENRSRSVTRSAAGNLQTKAKAKIGQKQRRRSAFVIFIVWL